MASIEKEKNEEAPKKVKPKWGLPEATKVLSAVNDLRKLNKKYTNIQNSRLSDRLCSLRATFTEYYRKLADKNIQEDIMAKLKAFIIKNDTLQELVLFLKQILIVKGLLQPVTVKVQNLELLTFIVEVMVKNISRLEIEEQNETIHIDGILSQMIDYIIYEYYDLDHNKILTGLSEIYKVLFDVLDAAPSNQLKTRKEDIVDSIFVQIRMGKGEIVQRKALQLLSLLYDEISKKTPKFQFSERYWKDLSGSKVIDPDIYMLGYRIAEKESSTIHNLIKRLYDDLSQISKSPKTSYLNEKIVILQTISKCVDFVLKQKEITPGIDATILSTFSTLINSLDKNGVTKLLLTANQAGQDWNMLMAFIRNGTIPKKEQRICKHASIPKAIIKRPRSQIKRRKIQLKKAIKKKKPDQDSDDVVLEVVLKNESKSSLEKINPISTPLQKGFVVKIQARPRARVAPIDRKITNKKVISKNNTITSKNGVVVVRKDRKKDLKTLESAEEIKMIEIQEKDPNRVSNILENPLKEETKSEPLLDSLEHPKKVMSKEILAFNIENNVEGVKASAPRPYVDPNAPIVVENKEIKKEESVNNLQSKQATSPYYLKIADRVSKSGHISLKSSFCSSSNRNLMHRTMSNKTEVDKPNSSELMTPASIMASITRSQQQVETPIALTPPKSLIADSPIPFSAASTPKKIVSKRKQVSNGEELSTGNQTMPLLRKKVDPEFHQSLQKVEYFSYVRRRAVVHKQKNKDNVIDEVVLEYSSESESLREEPIAENTKPEGITKKTQEQSIQTDGKSPQQEAFEESAELVVVADQSNQVSQLSLASQVSQESEVITDSRPAFDDDALDCYDSSQSQSQSLQEQISDSIPAVEEEAMDCYDCNQEQSQVSDLEEELLSDTRSCLSETHLFDISQSQEVAVKKKACPTKQILDSLEMRDSLEFKPKKINQPPILLTSNPYLVDEPFFRNNYFEKKVLPNDSAILLSGPPPNNNALKLKEITLSKLDKESIETEVKLMRLAKILGCFKSFDTKERIREYKKVINQSDPEKIWQFANACILKKQPNLAFSLLLDYKDDLLLFRLCRETGSIALKEIDNKTRLSILQTLSRTIISKRYDRLNYSFIEGCLKSKPGLII